MAVQFIISLVLWQRKCIFSQSLHTSTHWKRTTEILKRNMFCTNSHGIIR